MREEIEAAVHFFGRVIVSSCDQAYPIADFKSELSKLMEEKFKGHWHDDSPGKGQGYRSIRICPDEPLDPLLNQAATQSKFSVTYLQIPVELTVWVDPKDVTCRFGDMKATYCTLLKDSDNQARTLDVDELLENAKALYAKQQKVVVGENVHTSDISYLGPNNNGDMFGYNLNGANPDGCYLFPSPFSPFSSPWYPPDGMTDGSTPLPPLLPPPLPLWQPTATATTPRRAKTARAISARAAATTTTGAAGGVALEGPSSTTTTPLPPTTPTTTPTPTGVGGISATRTTTTATTTTGALPTAAAAAAATTTGGAPAAEVGGITERTASTSTAVSTS